MTSPQIRTAIFVISLETSSERRADFKAHAEACHASVPWSFYPARTELADGLRYHPEDAIRAKGRTLYPAELGCYASHFTLWQTFLSGNADQILILEDDVVVDWEFVASLMSFDLGQLGLAYLKLFNKNITPFKVVSEHFLRRTLIDCRGFAHGTQAYMLTRAGAQAFVAWCRDVRRPIDNELDRSWAHGIPNVAVFPFPAFERHAASTIGTTRYGRHPLSWRYQIGRTQVRISEKVLRFRQRIAGYGWVRNL